MWRAMLAAGCWKPPSRMESGLSKWGIGYEKGKGWHYHQTAILTFLIVYWYAVMGYGIFYSSHASLENTCSSLFQVMALLWGAGFGWASCSVQYHIVPWHSQLVSRTCSCLLMMKFLASLGIHPALMPLLRILTAFSVAWYVLIFVELAFIWWFFSSGISRSSF